MLVVTRSNTNGTECSFVIDVATSHLILLVDLTICPNGRARCLFQSNLSPEMIIFGDIVSLTPVFWGKKFSIRTACSTMYMVMIIGTLLKGRLCRSARQRSFITRIRRSISRTWSPFAARINFGDSGISSRQDCNGANSLSPWIVVITKPRLR
jgi:hypothetical protein